MPQELHVVQCFSCNTYQVDIVKKINKWTCKMCGEKQSLQKVYLRGTGSDCRQLVQKLNAQRLTEAQNQRNLEDLEESYNEADSKSEDLSQEKESKLSGGAEAKKHSKWDEFV